MRILDRYLAGAVIGGTLLAMAVLLPLLGFFLLADELDQVGVASYGFLDALVVMGLSLPRYAYQIFPIATLIGALVGLGALASRSELVAMRAAGVSVGRIVWSGLMGGVLLAILAVVVAALAAWMLKPAPSLPTSGRARPTTSSGRRSAPTRRPRTSGRTRPSGGPKQS